MAVLNIRIDDKYRDQLRMKAEEKGASLSEYVRDLVMEDIVTIHPTTADSDTEPAPETLSLSQRQELALLHRINARLIAYGDSDKDPEVKEDLREYDDSNWEHESIRAKILEEGFTAEYGSTTSDFRTELSTLDCTRVMDILQMFQSISISVEKLATKGEQFDETTARILEFRGFDFQDLLEARMASYVEFLTENNLRWGAIHDQLAKTDGGNSHTPTLPSYLRMLSKYRRIMDSRENKFDPSSYLLSFPELNQISEASSGQSYR